MFEPAYSSQKEYVLDNRNSSLKCLDNLRRFSSSVRRIHGLEIYFRDKGSVVVNSPNGTVVFFRSTDRGSYGEWNAFCEKLRRRNRLFKLIDIMQIAAYYDIPSISRPYNKNEIPAGIREHPARYIQQRRIYD